MNKKNSQSLQEEHAFDTTLQLEYLLFLPNSYDHLPDKKWPMIIFLHGAGERGNNLGLLKNHGIPKIVEQKPDFQFITVSPQCPKGSWWTHELRLLNELVGEITNKYEVDTNRIYLTGLSMGGFGTWSLASMNPKCYAAIAPICGGGEPRQVAQALKNMPIWVFHGAKDTVIPADRSEEIVKELKPMNGNVKFTLYPDADHDSWTRTYDNPKLYEWFLKHSK